MIVIGFPPPSLWSSNNLNIINIIKYYVGLLLEMSNRLYLPRILKLVAEKEKLKKKKHETRT